VRGTGCGANLHPGRLVEQALAATPGDFFLEAFSTADVVFTPYIERMNASLFYYKVGDYM
jgi:hypothetical protein